MCDVSPTASNIDRSVKDLQRCTASLTRYRMVVKEEMDSSIKRMKQTFAELQSWCVNILDKSQYNSWFVLQWSKSVGASWPNDRSSCTNVQCVDF